MSFSPFWGMVLRGPRVAAAPTSRFSPQARGWWIRKTSCIIRGPPMNAFCSSQTILAHPSPALGMPEGCRLAEHSRIGVNRRRMELCPLRLLPRFNRGWPTTRLGLTSCGLRTTYLTSYTTSPQRACGFQFWVRLDCPKSPGTGLQFAWDSLHFCIATYRRGGGRSMRRSGYVDSVRYCSWLKAIWHRAHGP